MPTYQYACTECGHRFEAVQAFTDASLTECPECGGTLRKVYGSVGVVFKGSGFYRTDSRAGSVDAAAAKADSTSADKPAAKVTAVRRVRQLRWLVQRQVRQVRRVRPREARCGHLGRLLIDPVELDGQFVDQGRQLTVLHRA